MWVIESDVADLLAMFSGTHRIQRIPSNSKARHTSTATVALIVSLPETYLSVNESDCSFQAYKGSGPGGQHRNKTSSAMRVTHIPTGIVTASETERSQWLNKQIALKSLSEILCQQAVDKAAAEVNDSRRRQVRPDRSAKSFTYNEQRDEVVDHETGKKWRMGQFMKGRIK